MTKSKLILIVEDDPNILASLVELLTIEGYRTEGAYNGLEALTKLKEGITPQLILLDLMMPVMNGFELAEILHQDASFSQLPIIIMSADGNLREKQIRMRAKGYLKKPANIDDVLAVVEEFIL